MEVWKDIEDILQKYGIRKDIDVCQLYLAKKGLTSIPDLSRFNFLRNIWLNDNKIRELNCHTLNCCLTELYLHNNSIKSISGVMSHLTCLRVLLLHNNGIRSLGDTVHELRRMQQLHTATLFLNPFSQEPGYRYYVTHHLPSVQLLDRKEVKQEERSRSFQLYGGERYHVLQSVAFGRRVESPTRTENDIADDGRLPSSHWALRRHSCKTTAPPEETTDPDVNRSLQRSIVQFSTLDCEAIPPTEQQEQQSEETQPPPGPRILTVTFR